MLLEPCAPDGGGWLSMVASAFVYMEKGPRGMGLFYQRIHRDCVSTTRSRRK